MICTLGSRRSEDAAVAGGKAAGCADLACRGVPTPRGVVVLVGAYDLCLARLGLDRTLDRAIALIHSDPDAARSLCEEMQQRLGSAKLPLDARQDLMEELHGLKGAFAVRSSALVEDGPGSSFAGVFHSELDVEPGSVGDAIARVWSSAVSYQALHHALSCGIDPRQLRMAVLIQEMVAADRAGVLFTRDPSGQRDKVVLSFVDGRGDRLMDGGVEGTTLELERSGGDAPDPVLRRLVRIARKLERKRGSGLDLEWAESGGKIFLLQARPITSDATEVAPVEWTRELTEERYPEPISPLGWSALQGVLEVNLETLDKRFGLVARDRTHVATVIRNYVYSNAGFFRIPGSLRPNPMAHLRLLPGYLRNALGFVVDALRSLRGSVSVGLAARARLLQGAIFPHAREIEQSWSSELPGLLASFDDFARRDVAALSDQGLLDLHGEIEDVAKVYMEPDLAVYVVKTACLWGLSSIAAVVRPDAPESFVADITAGLQDNRTLAMNSEMDALLDEIAREPRAASALAAGESVAEVASPSLRQRLQRFRELNGHLTTNWDLMVPTWGEDDDALWSMMRVRQASSQRDRVALMRARTAERSARAREEARARLGDSVWFLPFLDQLIATTHRFMSIDEEHRFYCSRLFPPIRAIFGEIGARLKARGNIRTIDDVYFLELDEVRDALLEARPYTRQLLVDKRRASFERSRAVRPPDRYLGAAPVQPVAALLGAAGELVGQGASPGVATGRVRIVTCAADAKDFCPGEILVTATPNPVFTPIYSVAAALISATGSVLSHGLVSAREYTLPAVIGVEDVTRRLRTGQKVSVNGDLGLVSIESE